jgi:hypothetical protein
MGRTDMKQEITTEMSIIRQRLPFHDPTGCLQVVECADDATGVRIFAVYDGPSVIRMCATREQSFAYMQQLLSVRQGGAS